jgi:hypothetical protein
LTNGSNEGVERKGFGDTEWEATVEVDGTVDVVGTVEVEVMTLGRGSKGAGGVASGDTFDVGDRGVDRGAGFESIDDGEVAVGTAVDVVDEAVASGASFGV